MDLNVKIIEELNGNPFSIIFEFFKIHPIIGIFLIIALIISIFMCIVDDELRIMIFGLYILGCIIIILMANWSVGVGHYESEKLKLIDIEEIRDSSTIGDKIIEYKYTFENNNKKQSCLYFKNKKIDLKKDQSYIIRTKDRFLFGDMPKQKSLHNSTNPHDISNIIISDGVKLNSVKFIEQ